VTHVNKIFRDADIDLFGIELGEFTSWIRPCCIKKNYEMTLADLDLAHQDPYFQNLEKMLLSAIKNSRCYRLNDDQYIENVKFMAIKNVLIRHNPSSRYEFPHIDFYAMFLYASFCTYIQTLYFYFLDFYIPCIPIF